MNPPTASWPLADARPGQVVVIAHWQPGADDRTVITTALRELVSASREEAGCLGYHAYHGDGGEIVLVERYADHDALAAHRTSDHFQRLALGTIVPLLTARDVLVTTIS